MVTEASIAVCCAICGAPHNRSNEEPPGTEWWQTVLLHSPMTEPPEEDIIYEGPIEEIPIRNAGGPSSFIAPDGTQYAVNDSEEYAPYIPVHPKCLEIAKKVLTYRKRTFPFDSKGYRAGRVAPASLDQFYDLLSHRSFCGMVGPQGQIAEPHQYFGLPDFYEREEWDIELERNPDLRIFTACPCPIPDLTQIILSCLNPLREERASDAGASPMQESLSQLPIEGLDLVCQHLQPFQDPSLQCSRDLAPRLWRELLFDQGLIPWLWDLDSSLLHTRRSETLPPYDIKHAWDWEFLVRQLAQTDVFEQGKLMDHVPLGLRNRRRVWRLIDEARSRDVVKKFISF